MIKFNFYIEDDLLQQFKTKINENVPYCSVSEMIRILIKNYIKQN